MEVFGMYFKIVEEQSMSHVPAIISKQVRNVAAWCRDAMRLFIGEPNKFWILERNLIAKKNVMDAK